MRLALFLSFLFFGCSKNHELEPPLARVEASVLYEEDLLKIIDHKATDEKIFDRIENWVTEEVLLKEALKAGFLKDKKLQKQRDLFYKKLIISSFLESALSKNIEIENEEILNHYNTSKGLFYRKHDEVFVHHFFNKEIEQARSIKQELLKNNNKKRTEELKKIFTVESKFVKKGFSIDEIDKSLFKNNKIGVIGPIRSNQGFHVFDIIKRYKKGTKIGLESSYDEIYQRLLKNKKAKQQKIFIDSLKSKTNIFINSKYMKEKNEK